VVLSHTFLVLAYALLPSTRWDLIIAFPGLNMEVFSEKEMKSIPPVLGKPFIASIFLCHVQSVLAEFLQLIDFSVSADDNAPVWRVRREDKKRFCPLKE